MYLSTRSMQTFKLIVCILCCGPLLHAQTVAERRSNKWHSASNFHMSFFDTFTSPKEIKTHTNPLEKWKFSSAWHRSQIAQVQKPEVFDVVFFLACPGHKKVEKPEFRPSKKGKGVKPCVSLHLEHFSA